MNSKTKNEQFSPEETKTRFETALRGARIAGPQHKESEPPKLKGPQRKKRKKTK
jgi:hypothetical protein